MKNPSLADLRDIHLPPAPLLAEWLPDVSGIELLAGAAAVLALLTIWLWQRRRRRLRAALSELKTLVADYGRDSDTNRLVSGLSRLLRHYAMARYPEEQVAGMTGLSWLEFLDAHGGEGAFKEGVGQALISRPYQPAGELDHVALVTVVRQWLKSNPS